MIQLILYVIYQKNLLEKEVVSSEGKYELTFEKKKQLNSDKTNHESSVIYLKEKTWAVLSGVIIVLNKHSPSKNTNQALDFWPGNVSAGFFCIRELLIQAHLLA